MAVHDEWTNGYREKKGFMRKAATFAIAIIFAFGLWLRAERTEDSAMYLVTSFDFTRYPACGSSALRNCIKGIRFYDADSGLSLAEAEATGDMTGQKSMIGVAKVSSIPRRVYAITVYLDNSGRVSEGPRGQISEFTKHANR
jgi:hypothetical protein